jgi:hypothetical protein
MHTLIALVLLAACELRPAPKEQPAPPEPPAAQAAAPVDAPPPAVDAGAATGAGSAAAGSAAPRVEISPACLEVGSKVAQVVIDATKDPAQKAVLEQRRTTITRKTGETCTTQAWSDKARACYLAAKTPAAHKRCEAKFLPRAPSAPPAKAVESAGPR